MAYLIATDEAGYGPKLGPLVIVATAWLLPDEVEADDAFASFREPFPDTRCEAVRIDDSKKVFKRSREVSDRLPVLDEIVRAASRWASLPDPIDQSSQWLEEVAKKDFRDIGNDPCLKELCNRSGQKSNPEDVLAEKQIVAHWSQAGVRLDAIKARIITPAQFNAAIDRGFNKADLLTEATCELAFGLIDANKQSGSCVRVMSDRHGGRAFYGAALQHICQCENLRVIHEGKPASRYEVQHQASYGEMVTIDWSFTISGDSFAPVAMSSLIAKWIRERAMACLNRYFAGLMPNGKSIAPTAGYPSDSDRFLRDLEDAGINLTANRDAVVRKR